MGETTSNGPSRKGSMARVNSITPSSSSQQIVDCGDHTLERDGRKSSVSSNHSPSHHRHHNGSTDTVVNQISQSINSNKSHHHSLDRDGNNKGYRDMPRHFYNTNPKPYGNSKHQKQQKLHSIETTTNNHLARQSMHVGANKSQTNLTTNTTISKSDANVTLNSSDECLNGGNIGGGGGGGGDRLSMHSHTNDFYKNRHMLITSNKMNKQYCKYHNFN